MKLLGLSALLFLCTRVIPAQESTQPDLRSISNSELLHLRLVDTCTNPQQLKLEACEQISSQWFRLLNLSYEEHQKDLFEDAIQHLSQIMIIQDSPIHRQEALIWQWILEIDETKDAQTLIQIANKFLKQKDLISNQTSRELAIHLIVNLEWMNANSTLLDSLQGRLHCQNNDLSLNHQKFCVRKNKAELIKSLDSNNLSPSWSALLWGDLGNRYWIEKKPQDAIRAWQNKDSILQEHPPLNFDLIWTIQEMRLGEYALQNEMPTEAVTYFSHALVLDQQHPWLPLERRHFLCKQFISSLRMDQQQVQAADLEARELVKPGTCMP